MKVVGGQLHPAPLYLHNGGTTVPRDPGQRWSLVSPPCGLQEPSGVHVVSFMVSIILIDQLPDPPPPCTLDTGGPFNAPISWISISKLYQNGPNRPFQRQFDISI